MFARSSVLASTASLMLFAAGAALAQEPPEPPPPTQDTRYQNLFYGAVPPNGKNGPVLVFIPGLLEIAQMWWGVGGNDMYAYCYQAGYRTAFMSPNSDNVPVTTGIQTNAKVLETLLPRVLKHFHATRVYFVGHSLGGLDIQATLVNPRFLNTAIAVFTLSTPNEGDILANWLFTAAGEPTGEQLGLLIPGVKDVETQDVAKLRAAWDPIFLKSKIPFYTLAGTNYYGTTITATSGPILQSLTGGPNAPPNDGVVDVAESMLPASYSKALGLIDGNHFEVPLGHNAFPFIQPYIQ